MNPIVEIQEYIRSCRDEDAALFDLQLLESMRDGQFEPGRLAHTILGCYKELVNENDVLADWDFPEETEAMNFDRLGWYIANKQNKEKS